MSQDKKIVAFIKKIRGILFGQVLIDTLLVFLAGGIFVCLILSVISMLVPFYYAFVFMAVVIAVFFALGIAMAFKHKPSMEVAALKVDSKGHEEKITTAYDLRGRDDAFSKLQKADAERVIDEFDIRRNFHFSFKLNKWVTFILLAVLFALSMFVETDARRDASYKHEITEKVKEEIAEIEKIEKSINENESISETEASEVLEALSDTKKELLESENYDDIKKAWDKEKLKLADATSSENSENEALNNILSEALEENTTRKNEELEELIKETEEAFAEAENGTSSEKEEASDKLSELAAALGNSDLSSAAQKFASSEKTNSDISNASSALKEALNSMSNTSYASSETSESSSADTTGSSSSGSENSESNGTSENNGSSSSNSSSNGSSGSDSNSSNSDGDSDGNSDGNSNSSSGMIGEGTGSGNSNGSGGNSNGSGTGGGWNRGSSEGSEGSSKTVEDVTIPDGELGSDENLTGTGNDNDSSTYEKSDESLTWSGNKVSYGQVSSEYKTKAYNTLESSSYPEAMKDKIKSYFDSLN